MSRAFGPTPLLELPLYDSEIEMQVREDVFVHHTLHTETLGDIWCWHHARPMQWFNPAVAEREWREYKREYDAECAAEKAQQQAVLTAQRIHERDEAARKEQIEAARERARAAREALERAEQERLAAIDHENKRKWAVHTSDVERRITQIVDTIDAGNRDRELMRAMLRHMNLGAGLGTKWDTEAFLNQFSIWRSSLRAMTRSDVERCYLMLKYRDDPLIEWREPWPISLVT